MSLDPRIRPPKHRPRDPFPLDYVLAILRADTEAEQREILELVPEHYLDAVGETWVDIDVRARQKWLRMTLPQRSLAAMRDQLRRAGA